MLGREVFLPSDVVAGKPMTAAREPGEWVRHLYDLMSEQCEIARERLRKGQIVQKRYYDLNLRHSAFKVVDYVYQMNHQRKHKLMSLYAALLVLDTVQHWRHNLGHN